jgi:hypothetical protein
MTKKRKLKPSGIGNELHFEVKRLGSNPKDLVFSMSEIGQQLRLLFRDSFRYNENEGLTFLREFSDYFRKYNGTKLPIREIGRLFKRWQVNRSYLKTFFKYLDEVNTVDFEHSIFCDFVELGKLDFGFGSRVTTIFTLYVELINKAIEYKLNYSQLPLKDLQLLRTPNDAIFNKLSRDQQVTQVKKDYALLPILICEMLNHNLPPHHISAMIKNAFGEPTRMLKWCSQRENQINGIINHVSIRFLSFSTLDFMMALCDVYHVKPELFHNKTLAPCDNMQSFLNALLKDYHLPFAVSNNFFFRRSTLNNKELGWCLALVKGNSVKDLQSLPINPTKSFIASFNNVLYHLDLSLQQAMIYSSLLVNNVDANFTNAAIKVLSRSDLKDGKYFVEVVTLVYKLDLNADDLQTAWDYFKHNKDKLHPSEIKRYGRRKLYSDIRDWHMRLYFKKNAWARYPFPKSKIKPYHQETDGTTISINQIVMPKELYDDGQALQHCVYAYERKVRSKECYIFSLKEDLVNSKSKRRLTIEIRENSVVQVRGKRNRTPEAREYRWIKKWARINKLDMACV